MKIVLTHKGEQTLEVTKPDAAIVAKAKPRLEMAATFFKLTPEQKNIVMDLCSEIAMTQVEADDAPVQQELPFEGE